MIDLKEWKEVPASEGEAPRSEPIDWSSAVQRATLSSDAIKELNIPKRQPILGKWFLEGDLGFIYGRRGLGKTWLSMHMARAISEGGKMGPWEAGQPRRVLYIDGEMPVDGTLDRNRQLEQKPDEGNFLFLHHEPFFHLTGKALNLTSPEAQAGVTKLCLERKIEVLFLDNLSCLMTLKENEADSWGEKILPWLMELRRHRIAIVFVHHAGRNGQMRGTSRREDAAFWSICLTEAKNRPEGDWAMFLAVFDKNRNATDDEVPSIIWEFKPLLDGSVEPKWSGQSPMQTFLSFIGDGLDTCTDLAQEMGLSKGQISKLAKKAERDDLIVIEHRRYKLK